MVFCCFVSRQHRCPHKPRRDFIKRTDSAAFLTEYETNFPNHQNTSRRTPIRPLENSLNKGKMSGETTNMRTFVSHPVMPLVRKPPAKYQTPEGVMDTTSEYKKNYQGMWVMPAQLIQPPVTKKELGEFDPSTTHSRDYVPKSVPTKMYKATNNYEPPKDPFNDLSTARTDYTDYGKVPVVPNLKPTPKLAAYEPFNDVSSYRKHYTTPPMADRFVQPKRAYIPSGKEFSGHTTNRSDFCVRPLTDRPKCVRPQSNKLYDDSLPLECSTTNQRCYKSWDLPTKFSKPPALYRPPTEKLSTETTFKLDYPCRAYAPPASSMKPVQQANEIGPFDGRTTKATDYKAWSDAERPPLIVHGKKYEPPKDKFDGISTFQADYLGAHGPRVLHTKPAESHIGSGKMQSMTNYRANYSGPGYKICPAALLNAPANGKDYLFSHEDATSGHQLYKPVQSGA